LNNPGYWKKREKKIQDMVRSISSYYVDSYPDFSTYPVSSQHWWKTNHHPEEDMCVCVLQTLKSKLFMTDLILQEFPAKAQSFSNTQLFSIDVSRLVHWLNPGYLFFLSAQYNTIVGRPTMATLTLTIY
jgi:hypothetical protein